MRSQALAEAGERRRPKVGWIPSFSPLLGRDISREHLMMGKDNKEREKRMRRQRKTVIASALMLSCLVSGAVEAEQEKKASREEKISVMGAIVIDALPYMTQEEEKTFNGLLKSAWERKMRSEIRNEKKGGKN